MIKKEFDFKFLNILMYMTAAIAVFYVCKNLGIVEKILEINSALVPVYVGLIICFFTVPIAKKLKQIGVDENISAIIALIIIYAIIALLFSIVFPVFLEQLTKFIANFPDIYSSVVTRVNKFIRVDLGITGVKEISTSLKDIAFVNELSNNLVDVSINTLQSVINGVVSIFTTIVVSFFMVKDMEDVKQRVIYYLTSEGKNKRKYNLIVDIEDALKSYVKGLFIDSVIVGALTSILCLILGIDYALVFGILIMILNFVPYIGAFLSEIIIALYALTINGPVFAIITFILLVIIQLVDANILQPNIVAKSVDLHPVVVFIGLLVGNILFGALGMIIISPILAIIKIILEYYFKDNTKKNEKEKINIEL